MNQAKTYVHTRPQPWPEPEGTSGVRPTPQLVSVGLESWAVPVPAPWGLAKTAPDRGSKFPSTPALCTEGEGAPVTPRPFFEQLQVLGVEAREQRGWERGAAKLGVPGGESTVIGQEFRGTHTHTQMLLSRGSNHMPLSAHLAA